MGDELPERDSGLEIKISIGLEYNRKRARITDKVEARVGTVGLLIVAGIVVIFIVYQIIPKVASLIP